MAVPTRSNPLQRLVGRRVAEARRARSLTQDQLATHLGVGTKYLQRIERGAENLTLATLERLADVLEVPAASLLGSSSPEDCESPKRARSARSAEHRAAPLRIVGEDASRAPGAVPLVSLRTAAGMLGCPKLVDVAAWVVPATRRPIEREMFVAPVDGSSAEPDIPSGSYCLFRITHVPQAGTIMLVQHPRIEDPDTGGTFALKRVAAVREPGETRKRLVLEPINPASPGVAIEARDAQNLRIVAVLLEVLGTG